MNEYVIWTNGVVPKGSKIGGYAYIIFNEDADEYMINPPSGGVVNSNNSIYIKLAGLLDAINKIPQESTVYIHIKSKHINAVMKKKCPEDFYKEEHKNLWIALYNTIEKKELTVECKFDDHTHNISECTRAAKKFIEEYKEE